MSLRRQHAVVDVRNEAEVVQMNIFACDGQELESIPQGSLINLDCSHVVHTSICKYPLGGARAVCDGSVVAWLPELQLVGMHGPSHGMQIPLIWYLYMLDGGLEC